MKQYITLLLCCFLIVLVTERSHAQFVTRDQALTVASNWVDFLIVKKGNWHGSKSAFVQEVQDFTREDRLLGYYCKVNPVGFVIVPRLHGLAPIKAYSSSDDIDPTLDDGMTDLFKDCMEIMLDGIEHQVGPLESARSQDLTEFLGDYFLPAWNALEHGLDMDYQEGDTLVDSWWDQDHPYNWFCPAPPGGDDCLEPHCLVGCVATAGSQIMRYWFWPPYGEGSPYNDTYDWANMPNSIWYGSPQAELVAVAELCHEVGQAVNMDYCGGEECRSGAVTGDMVGVLEDHYRYHNDCGVIHRNSYSLSEWFDEIKYQMDRNRPTQYKVVDHSIVCDGWREFTYPTLYQYHMNYGWGGGNNAWYSLDSLHLGNPDVEYMVNNIYPNVALGNFFSGPYPLQTFPYRYFDRDAVGYATFSPGQYLQFLPEIIITCWDYPGSEIEFEGLASNNTRLFTRGDHTKGVRIKNGKIIMKPNGKIKFH